jgi:hypothetical protein
MRVFDKLKFTNASRSDFTSTNEPHALEKINASSHGFETILEASVKGD